MSHERQAGKHLAEEAIQLHGGMTMMDESAVSHYAKRIIMIDHQPGDMSHHTQRLETMFDVA